MCKYFVKMETTERIIHLLPRWGLDALQNRGYKPLPQKKSNTSKNFTRPEFSFH